MLMSPRNFFGVFPSISVSLPFVRASLPACVFSQWKENPSETLTTNSRKIFLERFLFFFKGYCLFLFSSPVMFRGHDSLRGVVSRRKSHLFWVPPADSPSPSLLVQHLSAARSDKSCSTFSRRSSREQSLNAEDRRPAAQGQDVRNEV